MVDSFKLDLRIFTLMAVAGLTGILNSFTTPLKEAKIPVFAVSTWLANWAIIESIIAKYFM